VYFYFLQERLKNTFNKPNKKGEKIEKGIAFPTCMSINNTVCHFTPVTGDETTIKAGDLIKFDLGCHIDGFVAVRHLCQSQQGGNPVLSGRLRDHMGTPRLPRISPISLHSPPNGCSV
jgi:hypothetical protein